jgi:hypothetical protein
VFQKWKTKKSLDKVNSISLTDECWIRSHLFLRGGNTCHREYIFIYIYTHTRFFLSLSFSPSQS